MKEGCNVEWVTCIKEVIRYIEMHLTEDISIESIAKHVYISSLYLQRGFQILTGYSLGEYIRNRRLYEAGKEILSTKEKIITIAYRYGYETPESFSKAFSRFHGMSPIEARRGGKDLRVFHPIQIEINIRGGNYMDFRIEELDSFQVIGLAKEFSFETSYLEIPKFWEQVNKEISARLYATGAPKNELEYAFLKNRIGELGVCLAELGNPKSFKYLIGGFYSGGDIPKGLEVVEIPKCLWVKFKCVGPMPEALQEVNTRIYKEWLPGNKEYEIALECDIEWYSSEKDADSSEYISEIWLPVKRK